MLDQQPTTEQLFEQLGLDSDKANMEKFIQTHQLAADVNMVDAPYWNEGQRQFLRQKLLADDHWVVLVDDLNERLHADSQPK